MSGVYQVIKSIFLFDGPDASFYRAAWNADAV